VRGEAPAGRIGAARRPSCATHAVSSICVIARPQKWEAHSLAYRRREIGAVFGVVRRRRITPGPSRNGEAHEVRGEAPAGRLGAARRPSCAAHAVSSICVIARPQKWEAHSLAYRRREIGAVFGAVRRRRITPDQWRNGEAHEVRGEAPPVSAGGCPRPRRRRACASARGPSHRASAWPSRRGPRRAATGRRRDPTGTRRG